MPLPMFLPKINIAFFLTRSLGRFLIWQIYFDPPYRPITSSSAFTAYNKGNFNDNEQRRLKDFFAKLAKAGCQVLLSNSDGTAIDPESTYMDKLYRNFYTERVLAKRSISCSGNKRGPIPELLIRNYRDCQSYHPDVFGVEWQYPFASRGVGITPLILEWCHGGVLHLTIHICMPDSRYRVRCASRIVFRRSLNNETWAVLIHQICLSWLII